jgi:YbbR domain-containing protein
MRRLWEKIVALAGSNFGLKVLALTIAVGLWIAGHRDIERAIEVPVEFRNIPSDLMLLDNRIDYVVLRFNGPRTLVSTLDPDDLKLSLDLTGAKPGAVSYPLGPGSFNIPRGVTVARITPPVVHLRLEPVVRRMLPVVVKLTGKPGLGYRIGQVTTQPANVSVAGPAEELRRLALVETLPVDIDEGRGVVKRKVRLSADGKPLSFTPDQVEITVALEEEESIREFAVPVRAKDFNGAFTVTPPAVALRLSGAKSLIDKLELKGDEVFLSLKGLPAGEYNLPLMMELPTGVRAIEQKPQRFRVRITKPGN